MGGPGEDQDFPGKCKNKKIQTNAVLNGDTGTGNLELLKYSPDSLYSNKILGNPEKYYYPSAGYTFFVVE